MRQLIDLRGHGILPLSRACLGGRTPPQTAQFDENLIEILPWNELHRVIAGVDVLADLKKRHDDKMLVCSVRILDC
jgi:hypothetical protein